MPHDIPRRFHKTILALAVGTVLAPQALGHSTLPSLLQAQWSPMCGQTSSFRWTTPVVWIGKLLIRILVVRSPTAHREAETAKAHRG